MPLKQVFSIFLAPKKCVYDFVWNRSKYSCSGWCLGKVSVELIDEAVRHVLYDKFSSGAFEYPFADPTRINLLDNKRHRELAKMVSLESIVLLKNERSLLPLKVEEISSIALIGPNANDTDSQVGGYTQYGAYVVTPLEGVKNYLKDQGTAFPLNIEKKNSS